MSNDLNDFRYDEVSEKYIKTEKNELKFRVIYSNKKLEQVNAIISFARMIFIVVVMAVSLVLFQ